MNELKVGEVVSHKYKDRWYLWNVEKSPRSPTPNIFFVRSGRNTNFIHYDEEGDTWQRGIHPSLIPDGFCLSKIEDSETQTDLSLENVSLRKELEVAQKEIGKLQTQLGWARSNVEDSQKQIDRLSRNAERYQYLRSKSLETINEGGVFAGMTPENLILNGTDLDEAIDNEIVDEALLNAAMTLCSDLHDIEAAPKPEEG